MLSTAQLVPRTSTQVWKLIERDYTLRLSLVASDWATEHLRAWNAVFAEGRKRGNAGYFGPALVEMEIADADKRAEWSYKTCCEIWGIQGRTKCRPFFQAVFDWCLQPTFSTRESCFRPGLELHLKRTGASIPQGLSVVSDDLKRRMDELRAKWNTKLEIAARDNGYQEDGVRDPDSFRLAVDTAQKNENRGGLTNDRASTEQWLDLREQFAKLAKEEQSEVGPGYDPYIRATVFDDDEGNRIWNLTKRNIQRTARFEALAARAARSLEGRSKSESLVDLWLESLLLDLLQQRKEGANVKHLLFAVQPGDAGMIELVCHESATFCARLETKAHNDEARSWTFTPAGEAKQNRKPSGREPKRNPEFVRFAGALWKQKKGPNGRVNIDDLKAIGYELDSKGFTPPADYLEEKAAKELKARNSKNANSKSGGAILTWSVLVARADKDDLNAMRKLLSRYASKQP